MLIRGHLDCNNNMHLVHILLVEFLLFSSLSWGYIIRPFRVDLSSRVAHMRDLIQQTKLPSNSILGQAGAGIELSWLQARQQQWLNSFDWQGEQESMNR